MSEDTDYGMLVAFTDESDSFVLGFETGQVWEAMARSDPFIERTVHAVNGEVLSRMARAQGYELTLEDAMDGCWAFMEARKTKPARTGDDPIATGRFKVIEGGAGVE